MVGSSVYSFHVALIVASFVYSLSGLIIVFCDTPFFQPIILFPITKGIALVIEVCL